jgi:hypothetical protein
LSLSGTNANQYELNGEKAYRYLYGDARDSAEYFPGASGDIEPVQAFR